MMTWRDMKTAIEAQGVTDTTKIRSITLDEGQPLIVIVAPDDPERTVVKDTD